MAKDIHEQCTYKLVLIGDTSVGKTNLLYRFTHREFPSDSNPTIGMEYSIRQLAINNKVIKLQIWDTPGVARFKSVRPTYYHDMHGALIVFDLAQSTSFDHVELWIREFHQFASAKAPIILVGNKSDLVEKRQVTCEQASALAARLQLPYIETSAFDSSNVEQVLISLTTSILQQATSKSSNTFPRKAKPSRNASPIEQLKTNTLNRGRTLNVVNQHSDEHQKTLRQDFNNIINRYEESQRNLQANLQNSVDTLYNDHTEALLQSIDEWQTTTIEACCRLADQSRAEIKRLFNEAKQNDRVKQQINELNEELKKQKNLSNLVENDLKRWKEQLKELENDISKSYPILGNVLIQIEHINWNNIIKISYNANSQKTIKNQVIFTNNYLDKTTGTSFFQLDGILPRRLRKTSPSSKEELSKSIE